MNQSIVITALLLSAQLTYAANCVDGTLAAYIALGSGGCSLGGTTFSGFEALAGTAGATALGTGSVDISIGGSFTSPELTFSLTDTAKKGALDESIFTYQVSGLTYNSLAVSLSDSSAKSDGAVTDLVNECSAGTFGPDGVSGCTGTPADLTALITAGFSKKNDSSKIDPASFLAVTDDFTLDSGSSGTAKGGVFTNSFTSIPEPSPFALGFIGLALGAIGLRRRN